MRCHSPPTRSSTAMEREERASDSSAFGALLRRYRLAAGLSQEGLAERARMSANGLGALERGVRRTPQRETLLLLADALALNAEQRRAFESAATRPRLLRPGDGRASVTAGPWPEVATSNLPIPLTSFIGREVQIGQIAGLVRTHRLVTITGTGGIGKTRMALHVGGGVAEAADSEVWLIELAPISNPSVIASTIASTLGVQEVANRPLLQTLVAYLKSKTLLLIVDNCEHLIAEVATVADALLRGCPGLRILATSRESIRAAGEQAYRLPPLQVPSADAARRISAVDAPSYGAIALFAERARSADFRFALTDENAPAVAEVCRRLDGMPLAIELAASRVTALPVAALAEQIDRHFRILTGGDRAALPRQQTMRATIDWSYDMLAEPERRLFERLSVFAGGFTLDAATAVYADAGSAADVFDLVASLVDKSLVVADFEGPRPRYRLLESFRQYAREKLAARGEVETVARRHALVYLELAERVHRAADDPESPRYWREWTERAIGEIDNARAALEWALTGRGDVALGQRLVGELGAWSYYSILEGRHWIALAIDLVDEGTPARAIAYLRCAEGNLAANFNDPEWQLRSGEQALTLFRELGDDVGIVRAQNLVAGALMNLGRMAEAERALREVLARARSLTSHRRLLGHTLRYNAAAASLHGDFDTARRYLDEATTIFESLGVQIEAGYTIKRDLAHLELRAGNAELALRHAIEARHALDALTPHIYFQGVQQSNSNALSITAACLIALGRYDEAEDRAREALDIPIGYQGAANFAYAVQHVAAVAALRPEATAERRSQAYRRAAQLMGYIDACLAALKSPQEYRSEHDRVASLLREAIDEDQLAMLMAEGARMTEEQATELV
jgi:predicted ATPase/transcriptional regulator with XRE-family HTH domain